MARKTRAGRTKTELFEITRELVLAKKYSIESVIAEFNKRRPKLDGEELRDVIDVGLKVLTGRVRAARSTLSNQYQLLKQNKIPEFFELSLVKDGRREKSLVQSLGVTVEDFDAQAPAPKAKKQMTSGDQVARHIDAMRKQKFRGTIGEFLGVV
jgi:hypothetical protein